MIALIAAERPDEGLRAAAAGRAVRTFPPLPGASLAPDLGGCEPADS